MKQLVILFIVCIFALCSCTSKLSAIKEVEKKFPNSEIYQIYNSDKVIVIDSIGIYVVSLKPYGEQSISNVQLIKKWQSQ